MFDILASLHGKAAVVVGGSHGMGDAIVKGLEAAGAEVVIVDLTPPDAPDGEDAPPNYVAADITDPASVAAAYEQVDQRLGRLDCVINTVGVSGRDQASEDMPESEWRASIDVNLNGTFWSCQQAARRMLPAGGGTIVNFSSLAGIMVARTFRTVHYHAAKAAQNAMTRSLAAEWGPRGIRVNGIAPGAFSSRAGAGIFEGNMDELRAHHARISAALPLGRIGDVSEMAPLALFLASDASSYMTGTTTIIDGGRALQVN